MLKMKFIFMKNRKLNILRFIVILTFVSLGALQSSAQQYSVRGYAGGYYYLGDLAPLSSAFSLSQYNPGLGISVGKEINKTFDIHLKYTYGRISASDSEARDQGRRIRNLSFVSSIYDLGLITEIHLNTWLKGLDKYGLRLYYSTGVSLFHFNPKTIYKGKLVPLQPLGTEGQGSNLPNTNDKYSLTQVSIPFGFGLQFDLNEEFELGFEVIPRWTFTDYLDDVSGAYVPLADLEAVNGELSAALSNRKGEYLGIPAMDVQEGSLRGDPDDADWYMFMGVYISYRWGATDNELIEEPKELMKSDDSPRINF